MGFMTAIKSMFGGATSGMHNGKKAFFVDSARLNDEKTGRRLMPRDQIALLNALARIHEEEGFDIAAIFEAERPLREVDNGGDYHGVTVYFAADSETLIADALRLAKKGNYTLVTSGPSLESKAVEAKLPLFSSATFRKAFLANLVLGGDRRRHHDRDRDRGDDRGPRADRPQRSGRHRRGARHGGGSGAPGGAMPAANGGADVMGQPSANDMPAAGASGEPASAPGAAAPTPAVSASVRNLIDLVE
ncbi:MAG: hypothetical protein IJT88_09110 [Kiritimatiellae bacterium]|nr:hypothetical protein [Kiritimatiellia bacterium]